MARRGAGVVDEAGRPARPARSRRGEERSSTAQGREPGPPPPWEPETWVREREVEIRPRRRPPSRDGRERRQSRPASPSGRRSARPRSGRLPGVVLDELSGSAGRAETRRLQQGLSEAAAAYERDRYADAARILRTLVAVAPDSPSVRELYGLTLYRQGRWASAIRQLDAYHRLTGSYDQHPVLADCHRALGHLRVVDEIWDDLRRASPSADVVAEGRLVVAGARADRGDMRAALSLLRRAEHDVRRPRPHHVRQWYALADLYERSGDLPRARELFRRVLRHDAELSDAAERLAALG